jgi:DICT domain-containing protein
LLAREDDRVRIAARERSRLGICSPGLNEHDGGDRSISFGDPEGNRVELWGFFRDGDGVDAVAEPSHGGQASTGATTGCHDLHMASDAAGLSIGDLADATGVAAGTLRMWESRHGFPVAHRRTGGHRRYEVDDIARVQRVLEERRNGLSLAAAIERVREWAPSAPPSLFAVLRQQATQPAAQHLPVRAMRAISLAIEDECLARAARPMLAGTFQRETAYRRAEHRWRELARNAGLAFVLAEFAKRRTPRGAPAEIPLATASPVRREWAVLCVDSEYCACLAGWERPSEDGTRSFEAIWTTDPGAADAAMRVALAVAGGTVARQGTALLDEVSPRLAGDPGATAAVANRAIAYLVGGAPRRRPGGIGTRR